MIQNQIYVTDILKFCSLFKSSLALVVNFYRGRSAVKSCLYNILVIFIFTCVDGWKQEEGVILCRHCKDSVWSLNLAMSRTKMFCFWMYIRINKLMCVLHVIGLGCSFGDYLRWCQESFYNWRNLVSFCRANKCEITFWIKCFLDFLLVYSKVIHISGMIKISFFDGQKIVLFLFCFGSLYLFNQYLAVYWYWRERTVDWPLIRIGEITRQEKPGPPLLGISGNLESLFRCFCAFSALVPGSQDS